MECSPGKVDLGQSPVGLRRGGHLLEAGEESCVSMVMEPGRSYPAGKGSLLLFSAASFTERGDRF